MTCGHLKNMDIKKYLRKQGWKISVLVVLFACIGLVGYVLYFI